MAAYVYSLLGKTEKQNADECGPKTKAVIVALTLTSRLCDVTLLRSEWRVTNQICEPFISRRTSHETLSTINELQKVA